MKKLFYLIVLALILGLVLTGCSLLSNISQVPTTGQSGITYLTKNGILNPALVGLWRFNGDANDSSGYDNHGTVHGAGYSSGSPIMGEALSFDGVNDYVEVPDSGSLDLDRVTIEAWIYFETNQTGNSNIVRKGPWTDRTYGLDIIATSGMNKIRGWVNRGSAGGSTAVIASGSTVLSTYQWYHVAMTYDGSQVRVYVNSMQDGKSGTTTGNIFDNSQSLRIGGQPLGSPEGLLPFKGLIDEVRIWRTALTTAQLGDITPPVITILGTSPVIIEVGSTYIDAGATAIDNYDSTVTVITSGTVNTSVIGTYYINYNATDSSGNYADQVTRTVNVIYHWDGFFRPVDNIELNVAKAGRAIPVKFSLSGYQGLDIFAADYPKSEEIACELTVTVDGILEIVTAGKSGLSYDATDNQYIYVWKTDKGWANSCRQLVVKLIDGTYHRANFTFKK